MDTAARELEIEKKLQEAAQSSTSETPAENEEKKPATRFEILNSIYIIMIII